MPGRFSRTLQTLEAEPFSLARLGLALVLLLTALGLWLLLGSVTVYLATDAARLQVNHAAHTLEAMVSTADP